MTKDELIKCGCWFTDTGALVTDDIDLNAFAKLVAAKERIACFDAAYDAHATANVLEAIRARGEA